MCLHPVSAPSVPEETARIAHAAFRRGHPYLKLWDTFGPLFTDPQFASLFPTRGRPAEAPWRLAVVTLLQFAEDLSDRQAADAVRARLDWKYLLALEVTDPGFDFSLLSDFRRRLLEGGAIALLFEQLLERLRQHHLLHERGTQRTDSTHVEAAIRVLNRLELAGETLRHALNTLATVAPAWVRSTLPLPWVERYERPFSEWRLPQTAAGREGLARQLGQDGYQLLTAVWAEAERGGAWQWLRHVPALETLRQVWLQQFQREDPPEGDPGREAPPCRWRGPAELPPAEVALCSPYDPEARFAKKRERTWVGYKVHVTETCEPHLPLLLTDVTTTAAPAGDAAALPEIQAHLTTRQLRPATQVLDAGYVSGGTLVQSQQTPSIDLVGPTQDNRSWQAQQETGFAQSEFVLDWEAQRATCPAGQESVSWKEHPGRSGPVLQIRFAAESCGRCVHRAQCTRAEQSGRRLTVATRAEHTALSQARAREGTEQYRRTYAQRAGIEGTLSQGVRRADLRHCRYLGLRKAHLQQLLIAAALNLVRAAEWLLQTPRARTRIGVFARVMATA